MHTDAAIDFLESLPLPPKLATRALNFSMYSQGELREAVQSIAGRGYIGCLPFAYIGLADVVVRLLPARSPRDCPIGNVYSHHPAAATFAPALKHFVVGWLAASPVPPFGRGPRIEKAVLDYAISLGSPESMQAALAACLRPAKAMDWETRRSMLRAAAGELDPLFEARAVLLPDEIGAEARFEAACTMAADDPAGAYGVLANAARHACRRNDEQLWPQILGLALDLATANRWDTLAATLKLAQVSAEKPVFDLTTAKRALSAPQRPHQLAETAPTRKAIKYTNDASVFLASLPMPAPLAASHLCLSLYSPSEMRTAVRSLARDGFIGCLPFAYTEAGHDHIVVRLLPARSPHDCAIGLVDNLDGRTIAPAPKHFVAGWLAQLDATIWDRKLSGRLDERATKALLDYATSLGSAESTQAVLAACPRAAQVKSGLVRRGMLWAAAGEFDPLFEALGGAWMYEEEEIAKWVRTLRGETRNNHIVDRVSVGYHTDFATGEDVSEQAWRIITGDHVFDRGYTGLEHGPIHDSDQMNALVYAVAFLREKKARDERMDLPAWRAAQAAVDNSEYSGDAHFDAARAIADDDAVGAYTLLANAARYVGRTAQYRAALYGGRADQRLLLQILGFAHELATANQWHVLAATLKLALPASRARASSRAKTARRARKEA